MKNQFSLEVKTPCKEKFEFFEKTKAGGFCNSCSKEVIDFTKMTSQEIIQYFKKPQTSTCGMFKESQLTTYQESSIPKNRWQFRTLAYLGLSIISLFTVNSVNAQEHKNLTEINKNIKQGEVVKLKEPREQVIKGVIIYNNEPLPGATIILEGTTIGAEANFDGEFIFPKPLKEGDVLIISYLGLKNEKITISNKQLNSKQALIFELKEDFCVITGKVATKEVYKTKRSFWKRLTSKK